MNKPQSASKRARVPIRLNRQALAYWDPSFHGRKVDPGRFVIRVGASAENTPLSQQITVK